MVQRATLIVGICFIIGVVMGIIGTWIFMTNPLASILGLTLIAIGVLVIIIGVVIVVVPEKPSDRP